MQTLPLLFHPTQLIWIDDDNLFLQVIAHSFKTYQPQIFYNAQSCLNFFENYQPYSANFSLFRSYVEHEDYDLNNHMPVDINLTKILELPNQRERFQDIAVMIADYHMPKINGIELCRKLSKQPCKKILLTGDANHHLAVEAFNDGIIDRYIRKDDPQLVNKLKHYIDTLKKLYFAELTKPLLTHLEADYLLPQSDSIFVELFEAQCVKQNIREYYLTNKFCDFLMKDDHNQQFIFTAHTERTLNKFTQLYQHENEALAYIQMVDTRTKIPFFGISKEPWDINIENWDKHFYAPEVFEGRERYFWAFVETK